MKRLPIKSAKDFAKNNNLKQVIIAAWDGERTHIVSYGESLKDCDQAAAGANKIKGALGWPKDLNAEPARVKKLQEEIESLRSQLELLKKEAGLLKQLYIVEMTEHERGWGSKIDGYIAFKSEADALVFVKEQTKDRDTTPVPDYYISYRMIGYKPVSQKFARLFFDRSLEYFDALKELGE